MNQSEDTKALFQWTVRFLLGKHPEWLADTVLAMQGGIASALEDERSKSAIQPGLKTLAEFFEGTVTADQIKKWIEEANDE